MKMKIIIKTLVAIIVCINFSCQKPNLDEVKDVASTNSATTGGGSSANTVSDIDGNIYHTVQIGTQTWMVENLRVTKYRDGSLIPNTPSSSSWTALTTGTWCYYNDISQNNANYGKLYNWYTVNDSRGLAPNGWHVPTYAEWCALEDYLGGNGAAGGKLKESGTTHWNPNVGATNSSGFTGLPGGLKQGSGGSSYQGSFGFWWSTIDAGNSNGFSLELDGNNVYSTISYQRPKYLGLAVRCIKDNNSLSCTTISSGMITTIAGFPNTSSTSSLQNGSCVSPADGVKANQVKICPSGPIATDAIGNVFYSQLGQIRKVDLQGIMSTVAGAGSIGYAGNNVPATSANIDNPTAMAFDNNGNLVFADGANCRIRRINMTTGIITTIAGTGASNYFGNNIVATSASFSQSISGICFDAQNNLYFSDQQYHVVRKINSSNSIISLFAGTPNTSGNLGDGGLATSATLSSPSSLVFSSGKIYIATSFSIRCVASGNITNYMSQSGIYFMTVDQNNNLYYSNIPGYQIYKKSLVTTTSEVAVAGTGANGDAGDCGLANSASIQPSGIAFSQILNSIFFTDQSHHKIRQAKL